MGSLYDPNDDDGLVFKISLDTTHTPIQEPRPFSEIWSSHKFGRKPGLSYELGVQISRPRLLWISGPHPASFNDLTIFQRGLKNVLAVRWPGKRAIADDIYTAEPEYISTRNEMDPREIELFKDRVKCRHEKFNGLLKNFGCLHEKFRHGVANHEVAFKAVCAIVHYELETGGAKLYDPYP